MTLTTIVAGEIPAIDHREAMTLAPNEATALLDVVRQLDDDDWSRADRLRPAGT